jgi:hypothetical protein
VRERLVEQRLAAARRFRCLGAQAAAGVKLRIGQEGDFAHIGDQRVERLRPRLVTREFVDDDVADD